jgi:hypothetical protein
MSTSNAWQQQDTPTMYTMACYQCRNVEDSLDSSVMQGYQLLTGKELLKGKGGIPPLDLPSYFKVVGIPSHIKSFLTDKKYILHCHLPKYRRTCKNKIKLN